MPSIDNLDHYFRSPHWQSGRFRPHTNTNTGRRDGACNHQAASSVNYRKYKEVNRWPLEYVRNANNLIRSYTKSENDRGWLW